MLNEFSFVIGGNSGHCLLEFCTEITFASPAYWSFALLNVDIPSCVSLSFSSYYHPGTYPDVPDGSSLLCLTAAETEFGPPGVGIQSDAASFCC